MNHNKLFIGLGFLALFLAMGCRYGSGSLRVTPTNPPQGLPATSVPATLAPLATQAAQASATPAAQATATLAGASSSAQSIQIANQLKSLLDQLNSTLAGVNTLPKTPPGP
jgi:hypothetical protein